MTYFSNRVFIFRTVFKMGLKIINERITIWCLICLYDEYLQTHYFYLWHIGFRLRRYWNQLFASCDSNYLVWGLVCFSNHLLLQALGNNHFIDLG